MATEKNKELLNRKRRSLSLKLAQKEDVPFSPMFSRIGGVSPMTSLSINMGELTCMGATPKRRLSLSSTGDTPVSSRGSSQSSEGVGFYLGSPAADDSPFLSQEPRAFRRFNSLPSQAAVPIPPLFVMAKELEEEQGGAGAETEDMEVQRNRAETIMWEVNSDKENVGIQNKFADFRGPRPREVVIGSDNVERPISAPASLLERATRPKITVVNSPVKLQHCDLVSTNEDEDDGFNEIFTADSDQAAASSISDHVSALINAPLIIASPPTPHRRTYSDPSSASRPLRSLDCNVLDDTPGPKCRRGIFKVPSQPVLRRGNGNGGHSFLKRPDRPRDIASPVENKRYRINSMDVNKENDANMHVIKLMANAIEFPRGEPIVALLRPLETYIISPRPRPLSRSHSMDESKEYHARVAAALMPHVDYTKLTGDLRKPYSLPLCSGKHEGLQSITPQTLCRVLRSEISEVKEYYILDCRYPYEYAGGHIRGAVNLYTKELVRNYFLETPKEPLDGRVIIFHCEFSSKRGPDLWRYLRNEDRELNQYPDLYYPELYVLHGGYKAFYEFDKTMCEPQTYTPMNHESYRTECLKFRAKSKSWAGERSRLGHRRTSAS